MFSLSLGHLHIDFIIHVVIKYVLKNIQCIDLYEVVSARYKGQ